MYRCGAPLWLERRSRSCCTLSLLLCAPDTSSKHGSATCPSHHTHRSWDASSPH